MHGFTADIGYRGVVGPNRILDKLMDDLAEYRQLILEQVRARRPPAEISRAVDALCQRHGYELRHKAYAFETPAHRVELLPDEADKTHWTLGRFGLRSIRELIRDRARGARQGRNRICNSPAASEHPPTPGLWAVEPHLDVRDVGAKFEELLVVTKDHAYWLDEEVPHVRRWQARGLWPAARQAA